MLEVSLKEFLKTKNISLKESSYRLIFDIDQITFVKNIQVLFQELYYVLYYYNKDVECAGDDSLIDDFFSISPIYLHTNPKGIDSFLYLEAWYFLKKFKTKWSPIAHPYELDSLNPEQMLAVKSTKGVVWVSAPAGSGKTKTLINRILYLLNMGVPANRILVLAYNTKAAIELTERLASKIDVKNEKSMVNIRTFHSFGNDLLTHFTTLVMDLDSDEEKAILYDVIQEKVRKVSRHDDEMISSVIEKVNKIKENLLSKEEIEKLFPNFWSFFSVYLKKCDCRQTYGYEDMLYLVLCMILKNKGLRFLLQSQYEYILVDEFQDLNPVQLRLIQILSMPQQNLFVVGDDDQMIYSFRGSSNENTFSFMKKYKLLKKITLHINYRSHENLVRHAAWLISHNFNRIEKEIQSYSTNSGVISICIGKVRKQLDCIFSFIQTCLKENGSFAILCRYQEDVLFLQVALLFLGYDTGYSLSNFYKVRSIFLQNFPLTLEKSVRVHKISGVDIIWFSFLKNYSLKEQYERFQNFPRKLLGRVLITTVHKTKGNEFNHVCYYYRNYKSMDIEEERRIFYVAATRAKESFLLCTLQVDSFIREYALNDDYCNLSNRALNRNLLEKTHMLEENKYLLFLYQKDLWAIKEKMKYQISETKELYMTTKEKDVLKLQQDMEALSHEILLLREEQIFRCTLKKDKNMI